MTDARKVQVYDDLVSWVFDHCPTIYDYTNVLHWAGFTKAEAVEELSENCCIEDSEIEMVMEDIYGEEH